MREAKPFIYKDTHRFWGLNPNKVIQTQNKKSSTIIKLQINNKIQQQGFIKSLPIFIFL